MERIYLIKGIDCANCAREFEEKVNKLNGINKATLNFMTSKLIIDTETESDDELHRLASSFEDGVTLKRIK